jgi:phage tail-like protein
MATGDRNDPYMAFNFWVQLGGLVAGGFSEVSGLQAEIEVESYREGGLNWFVHRLAGPVRASPNLVLKRGLIDVDLLWPWYASVALGKIVPQNGTILLLDSERQPVKGWTFFLAYPVKWIGPQLRAASSTVAVETLELVHHGLIQAF